MYKCGSVSIYTIYTICTIGQMERGRITSLRRISRWNVFLASDPNVDPGLSDDGGCVVAEEFLGLVDRHIGELYERASGWDLAAAHRLPPDLAGFLPPVRARECTRLAGCE